MASPVDLQKPHWAALTLEEWDAITAYVHAADIPETTTRWHELGHEAGFSIVREVFASPTDLFRMYIFAHRAACGSTVHASRQQKPD